jgi:L-amino acid N-acyltransferase YncA
MKIRDATAGDLPGILGIYNDAVLTTTAIWNENVVDLENRLAWFSERRRLGYPVLVAEDADKVIGYASFGDFRAWDGYRSRSNTRFTLGRIVAEMGSGEPCSRLSSSERDCSASM